MQFGPVDPQANFVELERSVLDRWRNADVLGQVKALRKGATPWVFYEGPPTANARPGLHHVWPRAFKDLWIRFQTMRGDDVPRKGGWDCHGLPVETQIERELGLHNKHEIERFGVEEFNRRCRESVRRYVGDFVALTERSGVWIDTIDTYWTMSNDYVESVWWLVHKLYDDGLVYEGHRVVPYCPRCGTALSSHELGQPGAYVDVTDPSIYVRFPVRDRDVDLLVWTTTPWTLISNVAAAVGVDIDYVRVRSRDGTRDLVMAADRAPEGADVVERWRGADLVGWRYQRPFDIVPIDERGVLVREEPYLHAYPHCWRCGTALIYWAKNSWFVRTSERKTDMLRENERINWYPEHIKHGRFGDWLENNIDWALSLDRYWGTPLPIWRCTNGHDTCVGS